MTRLSTSVILITIALVTFSFFSGVSFVFSSNTPAYAAPAVLGITSTPTNQPDGGDSAQRRGGSRPPSIPEPTTIILTGLGLAGLAGYIARKKRHNSGDSDEV